MNKHFIKIQRENFERKERSWILRRLKHSNMESFSNSKFGRKFKG